MKGQADTSMRGTRRPWLRRGAACLVWLWCGLLHAAGGDVEEMRIGQPRGHWSAAGHAPMLPSIHLPTTHESDDLIHVWLKVPDGAAIDAEYLSDQQRWCLVFPPGTRSDRVEYLRIAGQPPDSEDFRLPEDPRARADWTVLDVRGTRLLEQGGQRFHVLRPVEGTPQAPLVGWSWSRGDTAAREVATRHLLDHVATAPRPGGKGPMGEGERRQMARLNDCSGCHRREKPRYLWAGERAVIERATDAHGFFVPQAVLSDDCVVANHRARDLNSEDPFVSVRCGDATEARLIEKDGVETYVCDNGRTPVAHRDVAAALAAGHAYTEGLCESRRWLHARMTARAREAFADAFSVCGIPGRSDD